MVSAFQLISGSKVPLRHLPHQQTLSSSLQSHLYLLVTDQGFLLEEQVVWESLHNVDGDSCFCDSDFHLSHSLGGIDHCIQYLERCLVQGGHSVMICWINECSQASRDFTRWDPPP